MLKSTIFLFLILLLPTFILSQAKVDLDKSVPLWLETDTMTNISKLVWIEDANANDYTINEVSVEPNITFLGMADGSATEFELGELEKGQEYALQVQKSPDGVGMIRLGYELPLIHQRGRCLVIIDDILPEPLKVEIDQLLTDIQMDGWTVDTFHVNQNDLVVNVKTRIVSWHDDEYANSQAVFLLGHVPVPYSGNSAHDGHNNHQGAWAADAYYGEMNGLWRDVNVNNTTPSREKNKNIPFDGKYDNTLLPSEMELEIGRVDFHDLPAFADDEIELTRQYLIKNHAYKTGNKEYPRRGMIENNFAGFAEGFGQSGWRNFTTMFGGNQVSSQNYEVILDTDKYLWSYACGGGSYTSCAGVGTTSNLWAAKDIQTIFTMNFGSYFGDWDSQNNFLRSALASGDVLTNAWAGRPVWYFHHMPIGKHIGYSAKFTQNASGFFYGTGFSSRSAHIALMGDPTLRLHAMKPVESFGAQGFEGTVLLNWVDSPDATHGHNIYRRKQGEEWVLIAEMINDATTDFCVEPNTTFDYMIKAVRLEETGSGSYYNMSLGSTTSYTSGDNPFFDTFYADGDMDGFGDAENFTTGCALPPGFVENELDCDDTNPDINPNAEEIPNNGIDEDCDGADLTVSSKDRDDLNIYVYPNPAHQYIHVEGEYDSDWHYTIFNAQGIILHKGRVTKRINLRTNIPGLYFIKFEDSEQQKFAIRSFFKEN
ncbi:MAG: T9SS type A sorting domain-containing protein [Bacteroidota bacterium]